MENKKAWGLTLGIIAAFFIVTFGIVTYVPVSDKKPVIIIDVNDTKPIDPKPNVDNDTKPIPDNKTDIEKNDTNIVITNETKPIPKPNVTDDKDIGTPFQHNFTENVPLVS